MADPAAPAPVAPAPGPQTPPATDPATAPKPPSDPPAPKGDGDKGTANTAAERRIREQQERLNQAEARATAAEKELADRKKAEMGDVERAKAEAEEAREEAASAKAEAKALRVNGFIRAAAGEHKFLNPENAVAMLASQLDTLDTETKAKNAVKTLAEANPHLIQTAAPAPGFGHVTGAAPVGVPGAPAPGAVPTDGEGNPDHKLGLGQELLGNLLGRRPSQ